MITTITKELVQQVTREDFWRGINKPGVRCTFQWQNGKKFIREFGSGGWDGKRQHPIISLFRKEEERGEIRYYKYLTPKQY